MLDLFEDSGSYGTPERLVSTGKSSWRFANDTGETFRLTGTALQGYINGDPISTWQRLF